MESTSAYIISLITALIFLLLAAIVANAIKFEGGSNPKDPQSRRTWFWILAILNPAVTYLLGYFIFWPTDANRMVLNNYLTALSIGTAIGFVLYILLGFILSKVFTNGKIGHWF
jgi:sulfoxide reductase heme-binding subunit YedZ